MIKVVYGPKGTGKTKVMVQAANRMSDECKGVLVFIDNSNKLIYDLKRQIRYTNITDYPVGNVDSLLGFICGILSQNYDVEGIFIDSLSYIIAEDSKSLGMFFGGLEELSSRHGIQFYVSISGDKADMPDCIRKYVL